MNLKSRHLYRILVPGFLFVVLLSLGTVKPTYAQNSPTQITLNMFALRQSDGAVDPSLPDARCYSVVSNRTRYGCTNFPGDLNRDYPFQSDTIVLNIEGDTTHADDGSQQGYLHNVISQEMAEGSSLASYTAQAITARTYAYYQTSDGTVAINNSASKQVYLPYRYEGLATSTRRQIVHNAVTLPGPLYMTQQFSTASINAHFGQDNCTFTEEGTTDYLQSVYDPISEKSEPCNNDSLGTPYGGMGSAGASRWGYGHTSEYNRDDLGDPWSVRWGDYPSNIDWRGGLQILTHYYTGIHLRDESGTIITPEYRWVPLHIDWHTPNNIIPIMEPGTGYPVTFQIQNTGIITWSGVGQFALIHNGWDVVNTQQQAKDTKRHTLLDITEPVPPGEIVEESLTLYPPTPPERGATYQLRFEMALWYFPHEDWLGFSEAEIGYTWPTYDVKVCVAGPCQKQVYLPLIGSGLGMAR